MGSPRVGHDWVTKNSTDIYYNKYKYSYIQNYVVFFSVVMYRCENWNIKKAEHWRIETFKLWCGEVPWESLDWKEIKSANPKGNQSWVFTGRTNAEAPIFWPPDVKSQVIENDSDSGKDRRQEGKGMTAVEMVRWHHWLNGHEFEQALGDGDEQGSLMCCSAWGHKESDMTEWLNNNNKPLEL